MRNGILVAIFGALLATSDAFSGSGSTPGFTADQLRRMCDGPQRNECDMYVRGVLQGIAVGLNMADGNAAARSGRPCVPKSISDEEAESFLRKSLFEVLLVKEQYRNEEASNFLGMLLASKFPCPRPAR